MNPETLRILESIARDRNIEREQLIRDLELAMISGARKHFNSLETEEFGCEMDRITGKISIWRNLEEGGTEDIAIEQLGRIPAQTVKQVMIQKFREDERNSLLEEFTKRVGELATGVVTRQEGMAYLVQIDRAEGFMPKSEQIPGESFKAGDRIRCLLLDVRDAGSQVKIILSRSHPDFIRRLFEAEVPEVAERVIEIKALAREPGQRCKVAVTSVDSKVDAQGACIGVRGSRIRNIVDEVNGEKIDVVRWNESSQVLIANALRPAAVEEVSLCFELGRSTIIVREDQLSLAIGKRGQNVRLAARLTGWDVDILTPVEFAKGLETLQSTLRPIEGVTDDMLDKMGAMGMISVFDVEEIGPQVLIDDIGMSKDLALNVCEVASERAKEVAIQREIDAAAAAARAAEDASATDHLLGGSAGSFASASVTAAAPDADAEGRASSILGGG
ncbi:MAG: transcription termination factor NusA [Phycisphaerales bacterium]|nr:transcription termination factor NusA [Phycisphaerales bacterium]